MLLGGSKVMDVTSFLGYAHLCNMVWSSDVDLNDGELQKVYQQYRKQLEFISGIGLNTRRTRVDCTRFEGTL